MSKTRSKDRTTGVFCECGNEDNYTPIDNRTREVLILKCNKCGKEQEWKLKGHQQGE